MRMIEVMPADVREWITHLKHENVSPHVIRYCMTILSAVFTTALNDVIHLHPVRGIKPPPVPKKQRAIITPEQFDQLYLAVCSDTMKLLVEADIESGMRWGELTELRPRDLDFGTGVVTVSRVAVELPRRFHPEGGRFLIKDYPKETSKPQCCHTCGFSTFALAPSSSVLMIASWFLSQGRRTCCPRGVWCRTRRRSTSVGSARTIIRLMAGCR